MTALSPDNPSGAALLDAARQALLDELAPSLAGRQRYVALMVANALGVVMRELEAAEATRQAWDRALNVEHAEQGDPLAALSKSIRAGRHDADAGLHDALRQTADVAAGIWKPARGEAGGTAATA